MHLSTLLLSLFTLGLAATTPLSTQLQPQALPTSLEKRVLLNRSGCTPRHILTLDNALIETARLAKYAAWFALNGSLTAFAVFFSTADPKARQFVANRFLHVARMAENGTAGAVGYICDLGEFMSELETDEVDVSFYAQGSENPEINLTANELLEMCSVGGNAVTVALRDYYDIILCPKFWKQPIQPLVCDYLRFPVLMGSSTIPEMLMGKAGALLHEITHLESPDGTCAVDYQYGYFGCVRYGLNCSIALDNADTYRLFALMAYLDCGEVNGVGDREKRW